MTLQNHPAGEPAADSPEDEPAVDDKAQTVPAPASETSNSGDRDTPQHPLPRSLLHDLRTPLNQIIGYSEMLEEQAQDEGQDRFVPDLHKIRDAGAQLLTLIDASFQPQNSTVAEEEATSATPAMAATSSSRPNRGTFTENKKTRHRSEPGDTPGRVLVVDDNEMNRDVLSQRLKRQGHEVVTVDSGREALAAVWAQAFDLVLLDIMMPEMDGFQVLQELKADDATRHIPVIMISALHEMDGIVRCIEMGADDYLFKPFDPSLLKARVGSCLEKKRARDHEARLFEQLQQNFTRLKELEQLRDDLTHMIIHDLRTPLTSIISGMQTLDGMGDLDEIQREMMGIAIAGGETLLEMINELLDVEKLEAGSMQLDYVLLSPTELVDSAVRQVASLTEDKNLVLVRQIAPDLPPLPADQNKLRRILVNLLGNAIKFTPSGGMVTVDARLSEETRSVKFSVIDTGEGIPNEAFERIFDKFGQVESRQSGRAMSTGLGLAFSKLATEAHSGQIGVESEIGKGSTFWFTIPLASDSVSKAEM